MIMVECKVGISCAQYRTSLKPLIAPNITCEGPANHLPPCDVSLMFINKNTYICNLIVMNFLKNAIYVHLLNPHPE